MLNINHSFQSIFDAHHLNQEQRFAINIHILACFGAAIGHRPYVPYNGRIYGNLLSVLVVPTGFGKGTAYKFTQELYEGVSNNLLAPALHTSNVSSMKQLYKDINSVLSRPTIAQRGDIRAYHVNEEFGGELRSAASSYQSKLPDALCKLADGSQINETFGKQQINYTLIHYCFMGHITPQALKAAMRSILIDTGCANRMLWFEMKNALGLMPKLSSEQKATSAKEFDQCLTHAMGLREASLTPQGEETFKDFTHALNVEQKTGGEAFCSMIVRFPTHVLKLGLSLALIRKKTQIDEIDISDAITLVTSTKSTISQYIIPSGSMTPEMAILVALENGPIKTHELFPNCYLNLGLVS